MTHALPPYPDYKESGIAWLGQVPKHWEVHTFRQVAHATKGSQPQRLYLEHEAPAEAKPYLTMEYLRAPQGNPKFYCVPSNGDVVANAGDILLLWDGANAGEFLVAKEGVVSSTAALLHFAHHNTRYIYFALKQCEPLLRAFSTGMGIPHVDSRTLRHMPIPLPPLDEQVAIVRFLDFVDGRMRRYARAQQQTIRLLTEYKQSLIHHAVTGKVNVCTGAPYTTYHDTGIEWLGQVPSHWEVCRLKSRLVKNESGIWNDRHNTHGTIVLRSTEQTISGGWRIENPARLVLSPEERETYLLQVGDLLVTKSSGSPDHIGKTSLVTEEIASLACAFSNFMQRLRVDKDTHPKLIWYYLNSPVGREQLIFQSTTTTGLGNLNGKMLGNCIIAIPPLAEQGAIVEYLDAQTARIDAAIAAVRRMVALVGEYRERLVADVVTGKVDVRAVAAGLPSDADAPTDTETYGEAYHVGDAVP
jgi:type I restriction enzyme S subunit